MTMRWLQSLACSRGSGTLALVAACVVTSFGVARADNASAAKSAGDAQALPSIAVRFAPQAADAPPAGSEVPSFQKHVSPLMGRLGCNGRACHGSFQGQGDFRLSLFGYDFEADHKALLENDRVNREQPLESLVLTKPVDADMHEGGKRFDKGGWEYWVLRRWIEDRAPFDKAKIEKLDRLEVLPKEMSFKKAGQTQQLQVFAHWESGVVEDVSCLCRYQTNDPAVATIDERGLVTAGDVGDTHVVVSYDNAVVPIEVLRPYSDLSPETYPQVASATRVDELVNAKLKKIGVVPSDLATDEEFLRRASLDVTGTLPTAAEVVAFMSDTREDKRARKIDELLERPGYAAQWATFFCDMTGNNDDQLRNFLPVQRGDLPSTQWYQWIRHRLQENVPYDKLVDGIVTATSRMPNESYADYCESMSKICQDPTGEKFAERPGLVHYWVRVNFRTPEEKAIGFAYSFLGVRIQCAQCHKHPFDQWTKADFDNFERLFTGIQGAQNSLSNDAKKEYAEMVSALGVDKSLKGNQLRRELALKLQAGETIPFPELVVNSRSGQAKGKEQGKDKGKRKVEVKPVQARLLGGDWIDMDEADIRGKLMDWLRSPENPYFAKALVNRVWTHYFSVGLVNPSDDLNLANAPSNAPLFDYLAEGFIENNFDLKWLHREILNSHAYQRSWITNETNRMDKRNFSHSLLRRLPAEAAHDAVLMALSDDKHSQEIADVGSSRALTLGGASAQVRTGDTNYALTVFGRSVRETNCDCDRSSEPSLLQTVFLLNDSAVQNWLDDSKQGWVASVARQYGWEVKGRGGQSGGSEGDSRDRLAKMQGNYEKQMARLNQQIKQANEKGDDDLVKQLKARRATMQQQIAKAAKRSQQTEPESERSNAVADKQTGGEKSVNEGSAMTSEQARQITEQAYLRSLSRLPNADEMNIAVNFLCSESDRTAAVESLIWGIVNTKEFILNH